MNYNELLLKAVDAYHREYGENAPLPEGGKIAAVCDEGVMIISCIDGEIEVEIIEKVYRVD